MSVFQLRVFMDHTLIPWINLYIPSLIVPSFLSTAVVPVTSCPYARGSHKPATLETVVSLTYQKRQNHCWHKSINESSNVNSSGSCESQDNSCDTSNRRQRGVTEHNGGYTECKGDTHNFFRLSSAFGCEHTCRLSTGEHKALIGPLQVNVNAYS